MIANLAIVVFHSCRFVVIQQVNSDNNLISDPNHLPQAGDDVNEGDAYVASALSR